MTNDPTNPYIFTCHNCGDWKAFEGTPSQVEAYSKSLGWLNEPQPEDEEGNIEYRVTCPRCADKEAAHQEYIEWALENAWRGTDGTL